MPLVNCWLIFLNRFAFFRVVFIFSISESEFDQSLLPWKECLSDPRISSRRISHRDDWVGRFHINTRSFSFCQDFEVSWLLNYDRLIHAPAWDYYCEAIIRIVAQTNDLTTWFRRAKYFFGPVVRQVVPFTLLLLIKFCHEIIVNVQVQIELLHSIALPRKIDWTVLSHRVGLVVKFTLFSFDIIFMSRVDHALRVAVGDHRISLAEKAMFTIRLGWLKYPQENLSPFYHCNLLVCMQIMDTNRH